MRVLSISHQRDAGAGVFGEAIAAAAELDVWHVAETADPPADPFAYDAVMTFGGAMHADQHERHSWLAAEAQLLGDLVAAGVPLLGSCLGAQLISLAAGGEALRAREPEIGWFDVEVTEAGAEDPLLAELAPRFEAFEWHSYECIVPAAATVLARNDLCVQAFRVANAWAIQFHAEVGESDVLDWIADYRADEDAVRIGLDAEALRTETAAKIAAWNELGRELARRFLAEATRLSQG